MSQFSRDINTIDRYLRLHRREYMEPLGLKGIHARLFMLICRKPGCSQDQLAKQMGFDKSTIARQLELLEELGFVMRKPGEKDKRILCVYPTQKMQQFQPGLDAAMQTWEDAILEDFTEAERQQLAGFLARIREKIGGEESA